VHYLQKMTIVMFLGFCSFASPAPVLAQPDDSSQVTPGDDGSSMAKSEVSSTDTSPAAPSSGSGDNATPLNDAGNGNPVVRAATGDMGMTFRFGGLATMTATGNQHTIGPLVFSQVGWKFVLSETWQIPLYWGLGIHFVNTEVNDASNDATNWGMALGGGIEYHFRIWRRISPFIGGLLGLSFEDPTGENNLKFGIDLGPNVGVEYYVGDRLSLTAQYLLAIQLGHENKGPEASQTSFVFRTLAGGAMILTYYF
jgi:hypothetical protein